MGTHRSFWVCVQSSRFNDSCIRHPNQSTTPSTALKTGRGQLQVLENSATQRSKEASVEEWRASSKNCASMCAEPCASQSHCTFVHRPRHRLHGPGRSAALWRGPRLPPYESGLPCKCSARERKGRRGWPIVSSVRTSKSKKPGDAHRECSLTHSRVAAKLRLRNPSLVLGHCSFT